jgi:transposase
MVNGVQLLMKAYSLDIRERVLRSRESIRQTAKRYEVSTHFIVRLRQRYRATGQLTPKPRGGNRRPRVDEAGEVWLHETLRQEPSLTLAQLCTRYETVHGVTVSQSSMDRTLKRLRISYKKNTGRSPALQRAEPAVDHRLPGGVGRRVPQPVNFSR